MSPSLSPQIIVVLSVLAIFANNSSAAMLALGLLGAPGLAVFVRGATRSVRAEPYIAAARVSGLRTFPILIRHVFPQITGPMIVQTSLFAGTALLFDRYGLPRSRYPTTQAFVGRHGC